MKKFFFIFYFIPGLFLSPSAYCLVNRLTCCQKSLCEFTLAQGQSDPLACLSQGGKWRPWNAISGRNAQTVWLLRQAWLVLALPKVCRRYYLSGRQPEGLGLWSLVVVYLFIHLLLVHMGTKKHFHCLTSTCTGSPLNCTGTQDESLFNSFNLQYFRLYYMTNRIQFQRKPIWTQHTLHDSHFSY